MMCILDKGNVQVTLREENKDVTIEGIRTDEGEISVQRIAYSYNQLKRFYIDTLGYELKVEEV